MAQKYKSKPPKVFEIRKVKTIADIVYGKQVTIVGLKARKKYICSSLCIQER